MSGKILAICVSETKGVQKTETPEAELAVEHGVKGDAHAGPWHRQVSFLDERDVQAMREKGLPDLKPGAFGENFVLEGVDLAALGLGSRLRLGAEAEVSITQIGKVCHTRCAIYEATGDCIMPRQGVFARVLKGGRVKKGDAVEVLHAVPRSVFQAVVITVSDRCARGETEDETGPAVARLLEQAGLHVYKVEIAPDDESAIAARLKHYCAGHSIDLVVTAGGTGFAPRDVTPEATRQVVERLTPGLDEAMRAASLKKTPHAMLSRAASGIRGATLIVNLPGSVRGATENLEAILPALPHGLEKLRGDPSDCGR